MDLIRQTSSANGGYYTNDIDTVIQQNRDAALVKKIGIFAFCFLSLLLLFNAWDNADLGDFGGPAGFFGGDGSG